MADGKAWSFFRRSRKNRKFFENRAKFIDFFFGICYTVLAFRARQTVFVCGCGEIGRHARLRIWCLRMQVQVLSSAPNGIISLAGTDISGCSAAGSALGSGPRGRGFKSRHSDQKAEKGIPFRSFFMPENNPYKPKKKSPCGTSRRGLFFYLRNSFK